MYVCMYVCTYYQPCTVTVAPIPIINLIYNSVQTSVEWYHIFTSGIQYYKLRMVFGIPRYLIKQVDEPLSSVNGMPQRV